jgi:hypothetical protein
MPAGQPEGQRHRRHDRAQVSKASGPKGKALVGTTANLTVSGNVSVQAWDCSAAGSTAAPQLKLRQLHVGGSPQAPTTTSP